MPQLFIRFTNGKFHSRDDGGEYANPSAALAFGIEGAVAVAAEEVVRGECNAAVVINVEDENGIRLLSSVVAVSVSPLLSAFDFVASKDLWPATAA